MHIINCNLPLSEYRFIQDHSRLSPAAADTLEQTLRQKDIAQLLIFGNAATARAFKQVLGHRVIGQTSSRTWQRDKMVVADAVLIATAPIHYPQILQTLRSRPEISPAGIICPFDDAADPPIALILETQPRSGTHYTITNIQRCFKLGYGSVFREKLDPPLKRSVDGRYGYQTPPNGCELVVKAHFYQPLHYPEYRYTPTLFQLSYLFDAYYSWGRMLAAGDDHFRLKSGSDVWPILQGYFEQNRSWLDYIRNKTFLRYEDYYCDFSRVLATLGSFGNVSYPDGFKPPRPNPGRIYWSRNYRGRLDKTVFTSIKSYFADALSFFWPERNAELQKIEETW